MIDTANLSQLLHQFREGATLAAPDIEAALEDERARFFDLLEASRVLWSLSSLKGSVLASNLADRRDEFQSEFLKIRQAINSMRFAEAKRLAEALLKAAHEHPRALYTLAFIAQHQNRAEDYLDLVERGLGSAPGNMILRFMHLSALEMAGKEAEALAAAELLPRMDGQPASYLELGRVQMRQGLNFQMIEMFDEVDQDGFFSREQRGGIDLVRGHGLRILGRTDEAILAYRRSIESRTPASLEAWWGLSDLTTYRFTQSEIAQLEEIVSHKRIPAAARCQPAFALAKARETASGIAAALPDYHRANEFYEFRQFDANAFASAIDRIIAATPQTALAKRADALSDICPIFIVGMPRSGSTLIEQILASHSQIEGTQELPTLPSIKQSLHQFCVDELGGAYLDRLGDIPVDRLAEAGQAYLRQTELFRTEGTRIFIDKLPQNFEHVGLINKILPQAVIIDARRHPMACGLSLYRQYFASGLPWAYDLAHIGAYYRGYMRLMDHWDHVLPDWVLHVRYEDVVADLEGEARRMLTHIGLSFEPACLSFYRNDRAVRTPSSEQVRQPVYKKSLKQWQAVADELAPLRRALGEGIIARYG